MLLKKYGIIILVLLTFGLHVPAHVHAAQSEESQLKAVFVLNFAKLTEWSAAARPDSNTFKIAILGKSPSESFVKTLQSQSVRGVKVSVSQIETVAEAKSFSLIYISGLERQRLAGILRDLNQQNILTVSDIPGFCDVGGMIGLVPFQDRLGFEVNLGAARKARLTISSQLLKLAKTIYGN